MGTTHNVPDGAEDRVRLVDHFKRAYQIIVGLAITFACTKLFCQGRPTLDTSFWLFCTFFITVVPIFHGGDRSLDIKYRANRVTDLWNRCAYIWDVYMLLITAVIFVKVGQALPYEAGCNVPPSLMLPASGTTESGFYAWMAYVLIFDIFVLVVDIVKSNLLRQVFATRLSVYIWWIVLNAVVAAICMAAADGWQASDLWIPLSTAQMVFVAALLRTVLDYALGHEFLFP